MSRTAKNRFLYILFNALFAVPLLALGILGSLVLDFALLIIGGLIILIGVVSFFPGLIVKIGIFDDFGNEYVATNFVERIISSIVICLIGGAITGLPKFLDMPSFFAYAAIMAIAIGLGVKLRSENEKLYLSDATKTVGQFLPLAYMLAGAAFMLVEAFSLSILVRIGVMALAFALHVYRIVAVNMQASFY